jgi:hypothetical protein
MIARILKWLAPGCVVAGLLASALGQVVYQVSGAGSDGSALSGSLTLNRTASTQASFNINNTDKAKFNLKGMLTISPAGGVVPVVGPAPVTYSISGTVYNDANDNGQMDPGESGIAGVTVYADLKDNYSDAPPDPSAVTDANGNFTLSGFVSGGSSANETGAYVVRAILPAGDSQTAPAGTAGQHVAVAGANVSGINFGVSVPQVVTPPVQPPVVSPPNPPATQTSGSAAVITVTNPAGIPIYPLDGVYVTCTHATTGSALTPNQLFMATINPNGGIVWNFGEPGSVGNQMKGYNAAHSYATAGQKTITLTVTPGVVTVSNGLLTITSGPSYVATATVNVAVDNRPTVNIQPGAAIPALASGTRYIFDAAAGGTTWNYGANGKPAFDVSGLTNVFVGSNGNPATLFCTNPNGPGSAINSNSGSAGITIQGITFDADATQFNSSTNLAVFQPVGNGGVTFLSDSLLHMGEDIYDQLPCSNVFVLGCSSPLPLGVSNYFCWYVGTDLTILNCSSNGSQTSWNIRTVPDPVSLTDVNISGTTINTAGETCGKGGIRFMTGQYMTAYGNIVTGYAGAKNVNGNEVYCGPGIQSDASEIAAPLAEYLDIDSNTLTCQGITLQPNDGSGSAGGVESFTAVVNNVINQVSAGGQGIWAQSESGCPNSNLYIIGNTVTAASGATGVALTIVGKPAATSVYVANNWLNAPGDGGPFLRNDSANLSGFAAISNNLWPVDSTAQVNGNSIPSGQWESQSLSGGVNPAGDVYANPTPGNTWQTTINGANFGSNLLSGN